METPNGCWHSGGAFLRSWVPCDHPCDAGDQAIRRGRFNGRTVERSLANSPRVHIALSMSAPHRTAQLMRKKFRHPDSVEKIGPGQMLMFRIFAASRNFIESTPSGSSTHRK
jgi:hypothetical protein